MTDIMNADAATLARQHLNQASLEDNSSDATALARRQLDEAVLENIVESKAPNTRRAYAADWDHFTSWCEAHGEASLPADPATVARYITDIASQYKLTTLERRLTSITAAHRYANLSTPVWTLLVRETFKGIRRRKAANGEQLTQKEAAVTDTIRRMVEPLGETTGDIHDRALLLIGFAGALRRSELVALNYEDVRFTREGLVVTVRRSKTDQAGVGREVGIPYGSTFETCPVRSLQAWLEHSEITEGPLFHYIDRHGNLRGRLNAGSVARIIKKAAEQVGLDPSQFAGHSLRAGFATAAAEAGVDERSIMAQTGHKSLEVARRYMRRGSLFKNNAAAKVGL